MKCSDDEILEKMQTHITVLNRKLVSMFKDHFENINAPDPLKITIMIDVLCIYLANLNFIMGNRIDIKEYVNEKLERYIVLYDKNADEILEKFNKYK